MAVHHVDGSLAGCHGYLSRELPPILTVDSGDTVVSRTNNAGWSDRPPGTPPGESSRDDAHNLCSFALDRRVSQVVDGLKGIHAMLPRAIFERPPSFGG